MGRNHGPTESGRARRLKLWVAGKIKPVLSFLHSMVVDTMWWVGYDTSTRLTGRRTQKVLPAVGTLLPASVSLAMNWRG